MTDKADHLAWAAEAIAVYQRHCRTGNEHAIADLICDLGHLAEERGFDFISEVRRGIGIGTRNFILKTATTLGRMRQSRSRSTRDSSFRPGSCGLGTVASAEYWLNPFRAAADAFAVQAISAPVRDMSELDTVVAAQAREPNTGLSRCRTAF